DVLGAGLLLDDVLEQEVPRVAVRALGVDGRAPSGKLRDVLVMLGRPRSELGARQLTLHPLLRERVETAVARVDRRFQLFPELAVLAHLALLRAPLRRRSSAAPAPIQAPLRRQLSAPLR